MKFIILFGLLGIIVLIIDLLDVYQVSKYLLGFIYFFLSGSILYISLNKKKT